MFDKNLCTLNKRVNDELVNINNWLKSNKLTPNYTKTKFMVILHEKNAKSNFEVTINKVPISNCYSYKYLGIIFDDDLKWKTHFERVSKKMSQAAGFIAKLRNHVSGRRLKLVYNCFAQCYLPEMESSRTHFEVLGLGLEASSPRKLPCPRLENSTIF